MLRFMQISSSLLSEACKRSKLFLETNLDEEFNIDEAPYFFPSRYGIEEDSDDESEIASSDEEGLNLIEKLR